MRRDTGTVVASLFFKDITISYSYEAIVFWIADIDIPAPATVSMITKPNTLCNPKISCKKPPQRFPIVAPIPELTMIVNDCAFI